MVTETYDLPFHTIVRLPDVHTSDFNGFVCSVTIM